MRTLGRGWGRLINEVDWEHGPLSAVALSPDGHSSAAGTDDELVLVGDQER